MDPFAAHAEATARNTKRIAAIAAGGLEGPTPCPDWSVADLVTHMIGY
jgi:Mycothiol maleylpyruvate isomerase N-terminal domain